MDLRALATDYDGTLAAQGRVTDATERALFATKRAGRKLILVTGRRLPDLMEVFPGYRIFDRVVAENGALLYDPETRSETLLAEAVPPAFVTALQREAIHPLEIGRSIVATLVRHEQAIRNALAEARIKRV